MPEESLVVASIAALGTATCWAVGSMFSFAPARAIGALHANLLRSAFAFIVLAGFAAWGGGWRTLGVFDVAGLMASGVLGVLLGDTLRYEALRRIGPRRGSVVHAANAPMVILLGWLLLGEHLPVWALVGCLVVTGGVTTVVFFKSLSDSGDGWESVRGSLSMGVVVGLGAAVAQAASVLVARPVMAGDVDVVAASAVRLASGVLCLAVLFRIRRNRVSDLLAIDRRTAGYIALSSLLGMVLGMTLLLYALSRGPTGVIATLSAMTPVIILPILWAVSKERPNVSGWIGAVLAVVGTAMIFAA